MDTTQTAQAGPLNLSKGGNLSLSKAAPGMSQCNFGLSWDSEADLDAFAFCLNAQGKYHEGAGTLYYGLASSAGAPFSILSGAIHHTGDVRDGKAVSGDDETIQIHLDKLPADVEKVIIAVTIYEPGSSNFGVVKDAAIRALDGTANTEIPGSRFELQEDYSSNTGVIFGELYRKDAEWKFRALGEGVNGDINAIVSKYH